MATLNDIVNYLETTLATDANLDGNIKWTEQSTNRPDFKEYGAHMYLGLEEPMETVYRKIGPIAQHNWQINVDVVINKHLKPRDAISDTFGVSYWENRLTSLFFHKNNNGTFHDSWWDSDGVDEMADSFVVKGIFHCEIENTYT